LREVCLAATAKVEAAKNDIGLLDVRLGEFPYVIAYPSCMVVPGDTDRRPEASFMQTELTFTVLFYVMHANLSADRQSRTIEDLELADAVTNVLHFDWTFSGELAGSWVAAERPVNLPRRAVHVVCTELTWTAKSRGRIAP
jgi:hypothetical protein